MGLLYQFFSIHYVCLPANYAKSFNFFFLKIFIYILKIKEYYNPQFQFSKSLKPHGTGDPFLRIST
ncbi:hypothetical protein CN372_10430 [Bacillus anthracis]|nr:hypothetical protein B2J90_09750 [Bacillus cereus]PEZ64627.1 hypothetical protein CN372_10430 [Bacillus anthracis]PFA50608.1 hypothetical protein CN391_16940 [Bacillus anthracis]PHA16458.1 hypothetical protein COE65_00375 [Bacillus sp. AFS051223]